MNHFSPSIKNNGQYAAFDRMSQIHMLKLLRKGQAIKKKKKKRKTCMFCIFMISSCFICFALLLLQIHPLGHKTNSTRFSSRRCFCFFLPCCITVLFFCATRKCLYEGRCNIGAMEPSTLKFSAFLVENKNVS